MYSRITGRSSGTVPPARSRRARMRAPFAILLALVLALLPTLLAVPAQQRALAASPSMSGLHVQGNRLVNGAGQTVRLLGVNRSGTEYACIQGWGFHDGPADLAAAKAIAGWNANAVRVPLNETCWLGINGAPAQFSGANYQNEIARWVSTLNQAGLVAVLELHWSHDGIGQAQGQQAMPNRDHSVAFWRGVATRFKNQSMVVFDLFNEPFPDSNQNTTEAWRCWRDGGTCSGMPFQAAGMQQLVSAVRGTGANNVIMLGGVQYSNSLWRWLEFKPSDPKNQLVAAWHIYPFNWYTTESQWNQMNKPVMATVPLAAGEIGSSGGSPCDGAYIERVMDWLDANGGGYMAWTWNLWGSCHDLTTNWAGTPTQPYGQVLKNHLAAQQVVNVPPAVRAPVQSLVQSSRLGTTNVPVRLSWSATDANGISRYWLQQSVDGGAYSTVTLPSAATKIITRLLARSHAYRFRVNAMDSTGKWGTWKPGPGFTVSHYQETNGAIAYTGTWRTSRLSTYYGGAVRYADRSTARAKFSFTGRNFAWATTRGPNRGKAEVYQVNANGTRTRLATVDLYSSTLQTRKMMFTKSWTTAGTRTLEVRALGQKNPSSSNFHVDVDAFIVLR